MLGASSSSMPGTTRQVWPRHSSRRTWRASAPSRTAVSRQRTRAAIGPFGENAAVWRALTGSAQAGSPAAVDPDHTQSV